MKNDANYAVSTAPVRFPQIWDASWFNWVQYNSSIADPLVRNIGEALGVRAMVKLYGPDAAQFESSINVKGLRTLEELLAGPASVEGAGVAQVAVGVSGARSAEGRARRGALQQHCQALPSAPDAGTARRPRGRLHRRSAAETLVEERPGQLVHQGHGRQDRLHRDRSARGQGLQQPHGRYRRSQERRGVGARRPRSGDARHREPRISRQNNIPPEEHAAWAGGRDPKDVAVRDELIYKARPLNGIWAVAPFLHNGSVPNLYLLLSPQSERPKTFWSGSKQFDPVKVGYDTAEISGATLFDTSKPGNSNAGHEFKDGPRGKGVIGPLLSPDDRMAIIEYLKSLLAQVHGSGKHEDEIRPAHPIGSRNVRRRQRSAQERRANGAATYAACLREDAVECEWFANAAEGYGGVPLVLPRSPPDLAPRVRGKPDGQSVEFGCPPNWSITFD